MLLLQWVRGFLSIPSWENNTAGFWGIRILYLSSINVPITELQLNSFSLLPRARVDFLLFVLTLRFMKSEGILGLAAP
jgi:hypothetical protein